MRFIKFRQNNRHTGIDRYLEREPQRIPGSVHKIRRDEISHRAIKVVEDLQRAGHTAYLVGGCVRDLLIGRKPKDFDVVTDATPQRIKQIYRYSRIIGRRFRIVHIPFGNEIIETATFRALPESSGCDEILQRDNVYGNEREDAVRRDISINALFYDPISGVIIDYVDGYRDFKREIIRMIRDPRQSFTEDPVRMIRALKFGAITGFKIEEASRKPIKALAPMISACSSARVMEEIYKIMRSGAALQTFESLYETRLLAELAPELTSDLDAQKIDFPQTPLAGRLAALDRLTNSGRVWPNSVLLAVLFVDLVRVNEPRKKGSGSRPDPNLILGPISKRMNFSRLNKDQMIRIFGAQRRLANPMERSPQSRQAFCRKDFFNDALAFFELSCLANGISVDDVAIWREIAVNIPKPASSRGRVRVRRKGEPRGAGQTSGSKAKNATAKSSRRRYPRTKGQSS